MSSLPTTDRSFYSLRPGRRFLTWSSHQLNHRTLTFLFPSTGTAFPNNMPRWLRKPRQSFYSLQPGRRFQTKKPKDRNKHRLTLFLFPLNEKAFPNAEDKLVEARRDEFLFPSTGKAFPNSKCRTIRHRNSLSLMTHLLTGISPHPRTGSPNF